MNSRKDHENRPGKSLERTVTKNKDLYHVRMGVVTTSSRNIQKPGSFSQNVKRAGSSKDCHLLIAAETMEIGFGPQWNGRKNCAK